MGSIVRSRSRIYILVVAVGLATQLCLLLWSPIAKADTKKSTYSWTAIDPIVFLSIPLLDTSSSTCATLYQQKTVIGRLGTQGMCMTTSDKVRFGTSFEKNRFPPYIGFGYDDYMYKLTGTVCEYIDSCIYLPDTDTLVTKQTVRPGLGRSLVIYKNFTQRITKVLNELTPNFEYSFDGSNPDYVFADPSGHVWGVGGLGASENGEWLAVEAIDRGMNLMNMKTFEMKRISLMKFSYWTGRNPVTEMAVSNDGAHVAIMGINAWLTVFEVDAGCGDTLTDTASISHLNIATPCQQARINTEDFIPNMRDAFRPRFDQGGGDLTFHATSYRGEMRDVSLRAGGYGGPRLDYLALGDSFSSGEGETEDKYYLEGTNVEHEKCHTSTRSYPYLIANTLGIKSEHMKSVACSGALTRDVVGGERSYWGQDGRLNEGKLNFDDIAKSVAQSTAKDLFIPGRVPQMSFVERYRPKVLTIGIGGNDVGFMDKLRACVGKGTCTWAGTTIGREKTALEIRALFDTLVATYKSLQAVSPVTKIYAVGYPKVIDPQGKCGFINSSLLDSDEKRFMDEGIIYINKIIAAAAQTAGIKYLDIEDSFADKRLCGASVPSVMNAISLGDDSELSEETQWFKVLGQEGFHPRPTGHALTATSILESVPNLVTYAYCSDNRTICPEDVDAPDPSGYWLVDGTTHNYASQRIAYFTQDRKEAAGNRKKTAVLPSYSFAPNSLVRAEIHSDPVIIGEYVTESDGALLFDFALPSDLEEGFHTIHLYGKSYSGEEIDLYEVIRYDFPATTKTPGVEGNTSTATALERVATKNQVTAPLAELGQPGRLIDTSAAGGASGNTAQSVLGMSDKRTNDSESPGGNSYAKLWVRLASACALGFVSLLIIRNVWATR